MERRFNLERTLTGRERALLRRAQDEGWLNAGTNGGNRLVRAYGRWCWRVRIPMVWFERRSAHSRYCRVHLDMFTTAHAVSEQGLAEIIAFLPDARTSVHDVRAEWVRGSDAGTVAGRLFRAATRKGNYELCSRGAPGSRAAGA
ncbi:MAG TPA: hypothetical protein VFA04_23745 [Bryobacteraceae bacterium]|nr:hypothetical protein [Bryobacteraceae bacterium]